MSNKTHWRVGKRAGQDRWQIKQAPGWRVAHDCDTPEEAAEWLTAQGVDISRVPILTIWPWLMLSEWIVKEAGK